MVAVLIVVLKLLFSPFIGMADELRAWIEADCRDARLGEGEMIGAVEGALLWSGVRRNRHVILFGHLFDEFAQRRALGAESRGESDAATDREPCLLLDDDARQLLDATQRISAALASLPEPALLDVRGPRRLSVVVSQREISRAETAWHQLFVECA